MIKTVRMWETPNGLSKIAAISYHFPRKTSYETGIIHKTDNVCVNASLGRIRVTIFAVETQ